MAEARALLVALVLLAPAAVAQGVLPRQPEDLRDEWADAPADDNGLPPPGPAVILDGRALAYAGSGAAQLGFRHGIPYNEWIVPLAFADPDSGQRSRSFLTPGLIRFHAWYGAWDDLDLGRDIDSTTDATNEWTGRNSGDPNVVGLVGFIGPGYHPSVTSDQVLLAEGVGAEDATPYAPDFEYSSRGNGEWISSHTILFTNELLIEEITVATVANALSTAGTAPGYTCVAAYAGCRVDVDEYQVVSDALASLYLSTVTMVEAEAAPFIAMTQPVIETAESKADPVSHAARRALLPGAPSEVDATHPYASMTVDHGAPRDPGGYSFTSEPHAFLDLTVRAYWTDATGFVVSSPAAGIPGTDGAARGLAPVLLGVDGVAGVWYDADADGARQRGELTPTCAVGGGNGAAAPSGGAPPTGAPAPAAAEIGLEWQNHPSETSDGATIRGILEAVDDAGNPTSWGTTGAYVLRDDPGSPGPTVVQDDVVTDLADLSVDRLVFAGPIPFSLRCDDDDPGTWSSAPWYGGTFVLLPAGTAGFNIRLTMDDGHVIHYTTPFGERTEAVRDVDWIPRWT